MSDNSYAFTKTLSTQSWDHARALVTSELAKEGFGILTEIDVRATLRKKLDVDFRPYVILGACNPELAHRALQAEPAIGALLPCNVVLQSTGQGIEVNVASPRAMFSLVDSPAIEPLAGEVEERLRRVLAGLN